jgi:hypothetical protein
VIPNDLEFWLFVAALVALSIVIEVALWRVWKSQRLMLSRMERLSGDLRTLQASVQRLQIRAVEPPLRVEHDSPPARGEPRVNSPTQLPYEGNFTGTTLLTGQIAAALESVSLDATAASEHFRTWCSSGRQAMPSSVKVSAMSLRVTQAESELRSATIRFIEKDQIGDFVLLASNRMSDEGFLFPHPDSAFNPTAHPRVFRLTREQFDSPDALGGVAPLAIRRVGGSEWEVA